MLSPAPVIVRLNVTVRPVAQMDAAAIVGRVLKALSVPNRAPVVARGLVKARAVAMTVVAVAVVVALKV